MQKVIILSNRYLDFVDDDNKPVKGRSIKYIERVEKNGENVYMSDDRSKLWIKPDKANLMRMAESVRPGEIVLLEYSIDGRRAVLSAIKGTGKFAVNFDSVFNE